MSPKLQALVETQFVKWDFKGAEAQINEAYD